MIFSLWKTFDDYSRVPISDLATQYKYNAGPSAISEDGSVIALAETWIKAEWQGPPGGMSLISSSRKGRINVRTGSNWTTNTLLTDPNDDAVGFRYGGVGAGFVGMSADGSVIASLDGSEVSNWETDPPGSESFAGTLVIHYGSSWGSNVRKHGTFANTGWGSALAVSGDGATIVVSELYGDLLPGSDPPMYGGLLHVYSGSNWSTHTEIANPVRYPAYPEDSEGLGGAIAISADGAVVFALISQIYFTTATWYGVEGESDFDLATSYKLRVLAFSGADWSVSRTIGIDVPFKTEHYHKSGINPSVLQSTVYYRCKEDYLGNYQVPSFGVIDCSDDGAILFVTDATYGDDKGAIHQFSGTDWATHTVIQKTGTQPNQYSGAQYTSTKIGVGSFFGDQVRCSADGRKVFARIGLSGAYCEFVRPSTTWNEAGSSILKEATGGRPSIARGSHPIMLSPATTTGLYDTWTRVDLLSYGFGLLSVIKSAQSKTLTAKSIVKRKNQPGSFVLEAELSPPILKVKAVIKRNQSGSRTADAVLMPRFFVNAVRLRTQLKALSAQAAFVDPYVTKHDRGNAVHYDQDLDSVITLGSALGVYAAGMSLHAALVAIIARIDALEDANTP